MSECFISIILVCIDLLSSCLQLTQHQPTPRSRSCGYKGTRLVVLAGTDSVSLIREQPLVAILLTLGTVGLVKRELVYQVTMAIAVVIINLLLFTEKWPWSHIFTPNPDGETASASE